jgi:hypothetical protein
MSLSCLQSAQGNLLSLKEPLQFNKKCIAAITLIALFALGAITVGLLAIDASLIGSSAGLAAMGYIGWPIGICLVSGGSLVLLALSLPFLARCLIRLKKPLD